MTKLPTNLVCIDCETSGLDPRRNGLLSIGAVTTAGDCFYRECILEDGHEVDPEALAVNGFGKVPTSDEALLPDDAIDQLMEWLRERHPGRWIVAGKNPKFDYEFLEAHAGVHIDALRACLSRRCLDVHALAYRHAIVEGMDMTSPGFSTDQIYAAVGLEVEPLPHHALTGAILAMQALRVLI